MNGYEKIVTMMKKTNANKQNVVAVGEMVNSKECKIGELTLDEDDYLIAEHLKDNLNTGDTVVVLRYSEEIYLIMERVV
mgnify:FL=1